MKKQSYISLMILAIFIGIGCEKEKREFEGKMEEEEEPSGPLKNLMIDSAMFKFFPYSHYVESDSIVFVNSNKQEKKLGTDVSTWTSTRIHDNNEKYETEEIIVYFQEKGRREYNLEISVISFYKRLSRVESFGAISIALVTEKNNGLIPWMVLSQEELELQTEYTFELLELHGRTFSKVYKSSIAAAGVKSYSELYYNEKLGIIGYRDESNELWRYERLE